MVDAEANAARGGPSGFLSRDKLITPTRAEATIAALLRRPFLMGLIGLLPILVFASGLPLVEKDPSVDAFVRQDHPAYQTREKARALFGLEDPIVVVFAQDQGRSAFTPALLSALARFTEEVAAIDGVEAGVISLASERAITVDAGGDLEAPLVVDPTAVDAERALALYRTMPPWRGTLVSHAEDAFVVVVPVVDPNRAEGQVAAVETLARSLAPNGTDVHLAGVATMNSRLAGHIARDTVIFLPAAFVTIALFLLLALRRPPAIVGPFIVVIGAALAAVGAIGLFGSRYYLITTALPVVVMAIAVADSIHLTLAYQKRRLECPKEPRHDSMAIAVNSVSLPIVLTSVTTSLGFLGLKFGSPMAPIADFGLVAAAGTMMACWLSLTVLPVMQLRLANVLTKRVSTARLDGVLGQIARWSAARPGLAVALSALVVGGALLSAAQVRFDYERRNYFTSGDDVLSADALLAERFSGANILDVVIDSGEDEGLLQADHVRAVAQLAEQLSQLGNLVKVTAFHDSISIMHQRLMDSPTGSLPHRPHAPAQYMFLYEASGDPEDFEAQLDFSRRHGLVRGYVDTGRYREAEPVVSAVEELLRTWSADTGMTAKISGRIAVNDGWMNTLKQTHAATIGTAVMFVFAATWIFLRSFGRAAVAITPVLTGVALLYAAMGLAGIDLAPATSMCAAIAAGLGVDFGIHLVQQLRREQAKGLVLNDALGEHYTVVMRACFFSALSLGSGFAVVALSQTPVLRWFGLLIAFAAFGSLFGAMVLVPAMASLMSRQRLS